jgi:hypothetical protein
MSRMTEGYIASAHLVAQMRWMPAAWPLAVATDRTCIGLQNDDFSGHTSTLLG